MKTLADIRRMHKGYWFSNTKKSPYSRIIGGLRRDRYIITFENAFDPGHYTVWAIIPDNEDYDIVGLTQFRSLELAKAEIANPEERAPLHELYHRIVNRFNEINTKEN